MLKYSKITMWYVKSFAILIPVLDKFLTVDINDENRFRKAGVQGPDSGGWNYPDGLFVGKGGT